MEYDGASIPSILAVGRESLRKRGILFSDLLQEPDLPYTWRLNREYFKTIGLKTRLIDAAEADTRTDWFGTPLLTPVFASVPSDLPELSRYPVVDVARGVGKAGSCLATGIESVLGLPEQLRAACETGTPIVHILKPIADEDAIYRWLERAEAHGCVAVGMDLASCTRSPSMPHQRTGMPVEVKTREQLRDYISSTSLPFVVKGVLSAEDAVQVQSLGARGIIVSNLGGRALDAAVHGLEVLGEIRSAVGRALLILVEGGFLRGTDVLKALALGADGVGMGSAVVLAYAANGSEGVRDLIRCVTGELQSAMTLCGCPTISQVDASIIQTRSFLLP